MQVRIEDGVLHEYNHTDYSPFGQSSSSRDVDLEAPYYGRVGGCGPIMSRRLVVRRTCLRLIGSGGATKLAEQLLPSMHLRVLPDAACHSEHCRVVGLAPQAHEELRALMPDDELRLQPLSEPASRGAGFQLIYSGPNSVRLRRKLYGPFLRQFCPFTINSYIPGPVNIVFKTLNIVRYNTQDHASLLY